MNILLDECVPWPLHALLRDHACTTPPRRGWGGITNGELLRLAEENNFDCFITSDQNIRYQQRLTGRTIAILELSTNDLRRIVSAAGNIRSTLASIKRGDFLQLSIP